MEENKKTKNIKLTLYITLILCLMVGVSYATYNLVLKGNKQHQINIGSLTLTYEETNNINVTGDTLKTDEEGIASGNVFNFKVSVNNTTNKDINYIVYLTMDIEYLNNIDKGKVYLNNKTKNIVYGPSFITDLAKYKYTNSYVLCTNTFTNATETHEYSLTSWISPKTNIFESGGTHQTIIGGTVKFKVSVETTNLDASGANEPILASNMIPVYYDETNETWRKADSTNSNGNYKWYNYTNKMWANAVTVKSSAEVDDITENKSVSLSNTTIDSLPPTTFTSGGKGISNAKSYTNITVNINSAGTFGFKVTVSSESDYDELTVSVSKNGGSATTVANAISGNNVSKTYSDTAAVGDVYVIKAQYTKDDSYDEYNDNGVLDSFTYPANTVVSFTDSSTAGGTSGQDWTSDGRDGGNGVLFGDSITYNSTTSKYDLNNVKFSTISSSLVGKFVCPTVSDTSCTTPYKVVSASSSITKVDEYKIKIVSRNDYINATVGTEISMDAINTMWVWIPRFSAVTPSNYNGGTQESPGAIDVTFVNNETSAHDAFTFGTKNLSGFWYAKFETSHTTHASSTTNNNLGCTTETCSNANGIIIKPNVKSLRYNNVSNFFYASRSMEQSSNSFGFVSSEVDTHMSKNNEWGAVAYLTQSIYGRCTNSTTCTEVGINNNSNYITGYGAPAGSGSSVTNGAYNTDLGKDASTTGNIYGIYDMSGGSHEYVMGVYTDGTQNWSGYDSTSNSGFTGCLGDCSSSYTGVAYPESKYYNKYTTSSNYTTGGLQHALIETQNWYSDSAYFVNSDYPWFVRGGYYYSSSSAGVFDFNGNDGNVSTISSVRLVITNE